MAVSTFSNSILGANPRTLDVLPTVTGTGAPSTLPFTPGFVADGDNGGEWVYCKLTLAAVTSLLDGHVFTIDKDYNASLIATANSPRGQRVGVGRVAAPNTAAGVYGLFVQVGGQAPLQVVATTPKGFTNMETTATPGVLGSPTSSTVGSKFVAAVVIVADNAGAAASVEAILNWPSVDKTN